MGNLSTENPVLNYELYANDVFGVMDQLGIAKTSDNRL